MMQNETDIVLVLTSVDEAVQLLPVFSNENVVRYTNFKTFENVETLQGFLEKFLMMGKAEPLQYGPYTIYYNHIAVGLCGLQQMNLEKGTAELWYLLRQDYWGKGIALKAVRLLLEEAKLNTGLKCICAEAVSKNYGSWNILEKLGCKLRGELKDGFVKEETKEDLRYYEMWL